ncbi:hypothetical protein O9929_05700 [Vibrio lentus]|nr:hypothetical protein [Vibrio lentus]
MSESLKYHMIGQNEWLRWLLKCRNTINCAERAEMETLCPDAYFSTTIRQAW